MANARAAAWVLGTCGMAIVASVGATTSTSGEARAEPAGGARAERSKAAVAVAIEPKVHEEAASTPAGAACPSGMVHVEGDYCPALEQRCLRWLDPEGTKTVRRCAEFAPSTCKVRPVPMRFCIDRFEYPNELGARPLVMKTWHEAVSACREQGKRLCKDREWTLACEGAERSAYPYGNTRDANACNIDKPHPAVDEKALADPRTREAEAARLWQGEPSGARPGCTSTYGVIDMTGNVDEWVVNESGVGHRSGLKGGYWGPVRDRCRPQTTAHDEGFAFYQIGFRCCRGAE